MDNTDKIIEERMQAECFQWHWNTYPAKRRTLFHVQQKARNAIEGARFKAIGVVQGISDMILLTPLACIEFKTPTGKQSKEQIEFQQQCNRYGVSYHVVRSVVDFKKLILWYYEKEQG